MDEERIDTDLDSWNSGDNLPDIMDDYKYDEASEEAKNGEFIEDEGDEDNLGDGEDATDDLVNLDGSIADRDDSAWPDKTFDCD